MPCQSTLGGGEPIAGEECLFLLEGEPNSSLKIPLDATELWAEPGDLALGVRWLCVPRRLLVLVEPVVFLG